MSNAEAIAAFWSWFQDQEAVLRAAYEAGDSSRLDGLLSARVGEIASGAGWEIGPYALPAQSFVLAPGGRERIAICREIVDAAPCLPGWRFFAGRPPKELLSLCIEIEGSAVCGDNWQYVLTAYNRGEFVDLKMYFEEVDAPPAGKEDDSCELLVQALVGESVALERIGYIDHESVQSLESIERATPLRFLRDHLGQVLAPNH